MVKNSNVIWILVFSLFIAAGCERYTDEPEPKERLITINFTTGELSGSLLKKGASIEEDLIGKVLLFGVDAQYSVVDTFILASSGTTRSIPKTVKTLWAVANPTPALLTAPKPANSTALMDITADFPTGPQSPFLMSGKAEIIDNSVAITFCRMVARIDLTGIAGKFQIESVSVNAAVTGYVFERPSWSVPALNSRTNYSYTGSTPVIYVVEHSGSDPVLFTVTGRFLDQPAHLQQSVVCDQFSIKSGGQNVEFKRNTYHQANVAFEWN